MCGACRVVRFFRNVLYKPKGLDLLPWQERDLREVYGRVDVDSGQRLIRNWWEEVPKKNGKSFLVGGLPLYHLVIEHGEIERPEAYGCASAKDQAGIVFRAAAYLASENEILRDILKTLPSTKRIIRKDGHGFYSVVSADGDVQDGVEPSLPILDEVHRWKTAKAQILYDVMKKGMISRDEALCVEITTAGEVNESPIAWKQHERARQLIVGSQISKSFFARIYAADEDKIKSDPEYWKSRQARVDANPSHEDNGGFLKDENIASEIEAGRGSYLRYHLNIWGQAEERWLPMDRWLACPRTKSLIGRECYPGFDLSSTTDFTALALVFPDWDEEAYDLLTFAFVPEGRIADLERKLHQPLRDWVRQGHLIATEGDVIDYRAVREKLDWARSVFEVQEVGYDPWNATHFVQELVDEGYRCVKVPQGIAHLTAPSKHFEEKVIAGKIRHDNNPVLNWHIDCCSVQTDPRGNIAPRKPNLSKDSKRIDCVAAAINGISLAMVHEPIASGPAEIGGLW